MSADAETRPSLVRDVLLLDGSTMRLRAARPDDLADVQAFYDALSPESRYLRFHGYTRTDAAARQFVEAAGVDRVALIGHQGGRIVAIAQYDGLREPGVAEVAFAVAEEFRNRGSATRLLEQLADVGADRGVHRFDAYVMPGNRPMLTVFERAGFGVRSRGADGEVTVSLDITPSPAVRERIDERDHIGAVASLRPILSPASVAVLGAWRGRRDLTKAVLARIREGGYRGKIVDIGDRPELVIIAVEWQRVVEVAQQAAEAGARALLVMSAADRTDRARREELSIPRLSIPT